MRREYFEANVHNTDDAQALPVVAISFDGPAGVLADRLMTGDGPFDANRMDVTYRLNTATDDADARGVLSIADRVTGEFVLEANVEFAPIDSLVRSVKRTDRNDSPSYRVRLTDSQEQSTIYDKETLLVYNAEGSLLRRRSLIPGGVEL